MNVVILAYVAALIGACLFVGGIFVMLGLGPALIASAMFFFAFTAQLVRGMRNG